VSVCDGRIESVDDWEDWRRRSGEQTWQDLGNVALIPGLVNAHTHLEFSHLPAPLEPLQSFPDWIRCVVASRRLNSVPVAESIRLGLEESSRSGTVAVGEIATQDDLSVYQRKSSLVVFRELLGLKEENLPELMEVGERHLQQGALWGIVAGLSPHAPYSVHPKLLRGCVDLCCQYRAPLAMHLAESPAELELLSSGTGPLRRMLEDFGVWREGIFPGGRSPGEILEILTDAPHVLVIHGNYLSESEQAFLVGRPQFTVVYCPRTHAAMGHPPHPWRSLVENGVRVALGTDSRASNPDLSLFAELQFLKQRSPEVPSWELLKLGTVQGAEALGLPDIGILTAGKLGRMFVVRPGETSEGFADPDHLLRPDSRVECVIEFPG
jgi:cytosine/adenosine deaminase-related metal-dependent hydrolase